MKRTSALLFVLFLLLTLLPFTASSATKQCSIEKNSNQTLVFDEIQKKDQATIKLVSLILMNSADERRGCCSHHGGVSHCGASDYWICNDGTRSPTCRCD